MRFELFVEKVRDAIAKKAGTDYTVVVRDVDKNNGIRLKGLMITGKNCNVAPTIYLDDFYEEYMHGRSLESMVGSIWQLYEAEVPKKDLDMSFYKHFDEVKDRICYRLIDQKQNKELLKQIPHVKYLDLAISFYYSLTSEELGDASILIRNSHLEMWGKTTEDLMNCAKENTPRLFPAEDYSMLSALKGMLPKQEEWDSEKMQLTKEELSSLPMRILSNKSRIYGATCILYPGVLENLANEMASDFFILPSSIHEGATRFAA